MKLSELSDNQLRQVATDYPEWMAVHNPAYRAEHQFQWMLRHYPKPDLLAKLQPYRMTQDAPDWMADNYPLLMIEQRLDWMLINRYQYMQEQHPDLVESFNAAHRDAYHSGDAKYLASYHENTDVDIPEGICVLGLN